jgi:hypothetical protein
MSASTALRYFCLMRRRRRDLFWLARRLIFRQIRDWFCGRFSKAIGEARHRVARRPPSERAVRVEAVQLALHLQPTM